MKNEFTPRPHNADETCKLQFEDWAHKKGMSLDTEFFYKGKNKYVNPDTRLAFEIWLESRKTSGASDLLAALEDVTERLAWLNSDDNAHIMEATEKARAAIKKARGVA